MGIGKVIVLIRFIIIKKKKKNLEMYKLYPIINVNESYRNPYLFYEKKQQCSRAANPRGRADSLSGQERFLRQLQKLFDFNKNIFMTM
jgi:hypothetical protein